MPSKNLGRLAVVLGLCCYLAAFNLSAEPLLSPAGLSTGGSSASAGALHLTNNPAAPAAVRYSINGKRTLNSGFGLGVARAGVGYSYGQVDEIVNELDSLYDTLANDDDINASDLGSAASDTENLLQTVETEGYITADLSYSFFPAEVSSKKMAGVWTFYPQINSSGRVDFTGSTVNCKSVFEANYSTCTEYLAGDAADMHPCSKYILEIDTSSTNLANCEETYDSSAVDSACDSAIQNAVVSGDSSELFEQCSDIFSLDSDSTVHVKIGIDSGFGVGFANRFYTNRSGDLFFGARVKSIATSLYQNGYDYAQIEDEFDGKVDQIIGDVLENFADDASTDGGWELDLGGIWATRNASAGLTMTNVLGTGFNYTDENGVDQTYNFPQQSTLELALYTAPQRLLSLSYARELNEVEDFSGESSQWSTIALNFNARDWFNLRLGQRSELVSQLNYTSVGFSLFSAFHLDIASSNETIELDGDEQSRSQYYALALEYMF